MSMNETLSNISKILDSIEAPGAPKTVEMTKAEFLVHAKAEVKKASEEKDEEKAKKRLDALVKTIEEVKKLAWEDTERKSVAIYEEPNLTAKTEESDTTTAPGSVTTGTMGDQSFAASEGAQSFAKTLDSVLDELKKSTTQKTDTKVVWPGDVNNPAFMKEGITKRAEEWGTDPE